MQHPSPSIPRVKSGRAAEQMEHVAGLGRIAKAIHNSSCYIVLLVAETDWHWQKATARVILCNVRDEITLIVICSQFNIIPGTLSYQRRGVRQICSIAILISAHKIAMRVLVLGGTGSLHFSDPESSEVTEANCRSFRAYAHPRMPPG